MKWWFLALKIQDPIPPKPPGMCTKHCKAIDPPKKTITWDRTRQSIELGASQAHTVVHIHPTGKTDEGNSTYGALFPAVTISFGIQLDRSFLSFSLSFFLESFFLSFSLFFFLDSFFISFFLSVCLSVSPSLSLSVCRFVENIWKISLKTM